MTTTHTPCNMRFWKYSWAGKYSQKRYLIWPQGVTPQGQGASALWVCSIFTPWLAETFPASHMAHSFWLMAHSFHRAQTYLTWFPPYIFIQWATRTLLCLHVVKAHLVTCSSFPPGEMGHSRWCPLGLKPPSWRGSYVCCIWLLSSKGSIFLSLMWSFVWVG